MKVYLLGFMGAGKSVYGQELAQQLKWDFLDLDAQIEANAGLTIPEIFEQYGESLFREWEQQALHATANLDHTVIATGGGTPGFFDNLSWMKAHGHTVYLKMLPDKLVKRLKKMQKQRPLIQNLRPKALEQFVHQKLQERAGDYMQAAVVIDPVALPPKKFKQHLAVGWLMA